MIRAFAIVGALTGVAAAEAAAPQQRQVARKVAPAPRPPPKLLIPILLEDTWHYANPDRETSTWDSADVKFARDGALSITQHAISADLILRGTWQRVDDSHITIERPYAPGRARYTLAACKDDAARISVCLFGPKL